MSTNTSTNGSVDSNTSGTTMIQLGDHELLLLERQKTYMLEEEVKHLKEQLVLFGESTEKEEERITNRLMKRLHELKQEKEQLALEVEREEELLTNTLQKKLLQVRQEKIDLENKLENEQEYIVNKLQKQLENAKKEKHLLEIEIQKEEKTKHFFLQQLALEKIHLENELEQEQEFLVNRLQKQLILSQKIAKQNKIQLIQQIFDQIQCKIEIYRLQFNGFEDFFVLLEKEMEQLKKEQLINIQNTNLDTSTINTDENKSPLRHHSLSRRSSSSLSITALPSPRVEEEEEEEKIKQQQQQQQKKQNDP